jgi:hypothetical protein
VAESTGKENTGVVPIEGEPLGPAHHYGDDRSSSRSGSRASPIPISTGRRRMDAHGAVARIDLPDDAMLVSSIGGSGHALAGALLHIDPFDEPNVQESKDATQRILDELARTGRLPMESRRAERRHRDPRDGRGLGAGRGRRPLDAQPRDDPEPIPQPGRAAQYLAVSRSSSAPPRARHRLRSSGAIERDPRARAQGYGPRYLHSRSSTRGTERGMFLILTTEHKTDLPIPKAVHLRPARTAQALGDYEALRRTEGPRSGCTSQGVEAGLAALHRSGGAGALGHARGVAPAVIR